MDKSAKTLVVVNPEAGRGWAQRVHPAVAAYLHGQGLNADFVVARSAEDSRRRAAEAAAAGYRCIAALGGDGTFQQLVRATRGADVVLAYLPAGGGNDVARALGIPRDAVAAAHTLLNSRPQPADVLRARFAGGDERIYVGGGGLGLDAEAAQLAAGKFCRLPGAARYLAAAFWALAGFEPLRLEIELDGERIPAVDGRALFAAVTNTPTYGAGVEIAPAARINDGLLDVVVVGQMPWTRLVEAIPSLLRTGDVRWPEIRRFRARRVAIRADRGALFHGDGEALGVSPVEVENLPGAIRVMAPPLG